MWCLCAIQGEHQGYKHMRIFREKFSIPNRWATRSLHGLSGGKKPKNSKGWTLAREPQPMRWNEITDGHWAEGCSTSEACYFNWIQRASFRTCLSWLHWPFPFPKAAWVLKLIGCENKSDEVSKEPPPVFLWRIYSLVPLFARYVDRIVVQQLLASLEKQNSLSLLMEPASQEPRRSPFQRRTCFSMEWLGADNEPGMESTPNNCSHSERALFKLHLHFL